MNNMKKLAKVFGVLVIFFCAFGVSYLLPKIIVSSFVLAVSIPLTIILIAVGLYLLHKILQGSQE